MLDRLASTLLPRVGPGQFFAPSERKVMTAAAETMLEGAELELAPERVARNVEQFLLWGRSRRAWRIRVLLQVIEWAPVFLLGRRRFTRMGRAARRQLVESRYVKGGGVWSLCGKIRHLIYMGAYGDERANPAVGFLPWPARARSRARSAADSRGERATGG